MAIKFNFRCNGCNLMSSSAPMSSDNNPVCPEFCSNCLTNGAPNHAIAYVFWIVLFGFAVAASLGHCHSLSMVEMETTDSENVTHLQSATIAFVGDVNFTARIGEYIAVSGTTWPFEKVKGILAKADYRVCNLENPAGLGGAKFCEKSVYFKANPKYLDALNDAGFNMVTLANNHALDYGPDVLEQTRLELFKRNIYSIGITERRGQHYIPKIVDIKGLKVAILGYCNACPNEFGPTSFSAGVNVGMAGMIKKQIGDLKRDYHPDFIIAMPHWGTEYSLVDKNQEFTNKVFMDAGVDLVVGAHPHVLQKTVSIQYNGGNRVTAFSLGNFVFPMRWQVSLDSAMLFVKLIKGGGEKGIVSSWVPVSLDSNRPIPIEPGTERFKRDMYIIKNGYTYPNNRRWPEHGPWSKQ